MDPNLTIPPNAVHRDGLSRVSIEAITIRREPCGLLRVWSRSPDSDPSDIESWLPTSAAIAVPVRDLPEIIAQLETVMRAAA